MSYWNWLGELIKPILNKLKNSNAEAGGGIIITGICAGLAVGLGQSFNRLYYLLFLGLIPGSLMMLHSIYRSQMREKEKD